MMAKAHSFPAPISSPSLTRALPTDFLLLTVGCGCGGSLLLDQPFCPFCIVVFDVQQREVFFLAVQTAQSFVTVFAEMPSGETRETEPDYL